MTVEDFVQCAGAAIRGVDSVLKRKLKSTASSPGMTLPRAGAGA